jgi:hypothetical protein
VAPTAVDVVRAVDDPMFIVVVTALACGFGVEMVLAVTPRPVVAVGRVLGVVASGDDAAADESACDVVGVDPPAGSACATPAPAVSAAPTPNVTAPAPSQLDTGNGRVRRWPLLGMQDGLARFRVARGIIATYHFVAMSEPFSTETAESLG